MSSAARIRLEGALEQVEATLSAWEEAAALLRGAQWRTFPAVPALSWKTTTAARGYVPTDPEAATVFGRLARAQSTVEAGVARRLKRIGVSGLALEDGLNVLHAEYPIRFQHHLGWSGVLTARLVGSIAFGLTVAICSAALAPIFFFGTFIGAYFWIQGAEWMDVILTARTLVLGDHPLRLSAIDHVRVCHGWRFELTVVAKDGRRISTWSGQEPVELLRGLEDSGVPLRHACRPLW